MSGMDPTLSGDCRSRSFDAPASAGGLERDPSAVQSAIDENTAGLGLSLELQSAMRQPAGSQPSAAAAVQHRQPQPLSAAEVRRFAAPPPGLFPATEASAADADDYADLAESHDVDAVLEAMERHLMGRPTDDDDRRVVEALVAMGQLQQHNPARLAEVVLERTCDAK